MHLLVNQNEICAWCEVEVELDASHIDHIRAKGQHPHLTFEIGNLVASCQASDTCGHGRAGKGDLPAWIHSYDTAELESHFRYDPDGSIRPADNVGEDHASVANDAINRQLNLNARTLKERRESQMAQIRAFFGQNLTSEQIASCFPSFPSLTAQILS